MRRSRIYVDATAFFDALDQRDRQPLDPLEELERLSFESVALKDFFRAQLQQVIDREGVTASGVGDALSFYVPAVERAAKLVEQYARTGLEKRMVEIRAEVAGLISGLLNQLLATYVPADQQGAARELVNRGLLMIEAASP